MMTVPGAPSLPTAELEWISAFAARLAGSEADDLVQETLVTASQAPAPAARRPWLATVMRNRLRMKARSEGARRAREAAYEASRPEAVSPEAAVHRLAVLRALIEELEALPAVERRIVEARHCEGLDATRIGEELGLPASTVRSRLRRTRTRLAAALDRRFEGERVLWAAAVALPPWVSTPVATTTGGAIALLSAKSTLLLGATLLVLATATWLVGRGGSGPAEPEGLALGPDAAPVSRARRPERVEDARASWERRGREIRRAFDAAAAPPADPEAATPPRAVDPEERASLVEEARRVQVEQVELCVEDTELDLEGALILRSRILGAPDVGTIYETLEVLGATEASAALVACIEDGMFAFVGPAPAAPFEEVTTITHLGQPPPELEEEAWRRRMFEAVLVAHEAEVEGCAAAEGRVAGEVALRFTFDGKPEPARVEVEDATLREPVVACITAAAAAWKFPRKLAGEPLSHRFRLLATDDAG